MTITMIAAVARNGVIGDGERMPWHLPQDLAHFRATTMGHTLLMGRRTFAAIGRVLPGRRHIVLTRDRAWHHPGVEVAHSFEEGLALAGPTEVFVAGGGQVYQLGMPYAQRLVITHVDLDAQGSVTFPHIDPREWAETSRRPEEGFSIVVYDRR
ncbi:MAG: dihydrofolate reductase [Dermatophilaceae bacterium]